MPGLTLLLETARRALMAQQVGISIVGHNVSNATTPGYSRQRVNLSPTMALKEPYGFLGTGVTVDSVTRIRDRFLDQQMRMTNGFLGSATAQQNILTQVEAAFNEPSDAGLSAGMTAFFNSFQDLSTHPEESSARNSVIQQGTLLAQSFHRVRGEITQLHDSLLDDVSTKVARINQLTTEISDLDIRITGAIATGSQPNDLQDQRDLKIEELSGLANVSVSEDGRGSVMVSISGMVVASRAGSVALRVDNASSPLQVVTAREGVPVSIAGGELGGTLKLYNTTLPGYVSKLDELAGALIARVNTLHRAGYGLGTPPPTGTDFFTGTTAADIDLNAAVAGNPSLVAASQTGAPGDNAVALLLAGVPNDKILTGNTVTLAQFYNGLASSVGSDITNADSTVTSQELIQSQLDNQRSSVSGVSVDEEMTDLIKYQRAFDAAARLVTTTNDMFQSLLNMV